MPNVNPEEFGAVQQVAIDPAQFGAMANIDEERGAPSRVRIAVGSTAKPKDKLATLQKYYPDAKPWGTDNFVYTDPETKASTLYNPKGMDWGDVHESARILFEFVGGAGGAAIATIGGQMGPQIAVPEELVTVPLATGIGAAAAGQAYDALTSLFLPKVENKTLLEGVAGVTTDVVMNATGQKIGDVLAKKIKGALSGGAQMARAGSDAIAKAFREAAVEPVAGAISGSKTLQGFENALAKLPLSADVIGKAYNKTIDDISNYAMKIARGMSPIEGRELVGMEIKKGAEKFVAQFKVQAGQLYDEVDKFVQPGTRVGSPNLAKKIDEVLTQFADDPEFAEMLTSPMFKQMRVALKSSEKAGGMTYKTLKALRSKIGESIGSPELLGNASRAEIKQLYGAISDDMMLAAGEFGPEAVKAAKRASNYWSAGRSRIDDVLAPVVEKKMAQDIFKAALAGSKEGAQRLRTIKKSIPADKWSSVVAQQIREMGMATPGKQDVTGELFSPATFMTNFSRLSKEAKSTLFSGRHYDGLEKSLDRLTKISASIKDNAAMANNSGTAQQLIYMNVLTGGIGGLIGASSGDAEGGALTGMAIGAATPWVAAKLITSPKFINWLADAAKAPMTSSGMTQHLTRLALIAERDAEIRPAIYEYMDNMRSVKNE